MASNPQDIINRLRSSDQNERDGAQDFLAESAKQGWYIVNGQWQQGSKTTQDMSTRSFVGLSPEAYNKVVDMATGVGKTPGQTTTTQQTSGNQQTTGQFAPTSPTTPTQLGAQVSPLGLTPTINNVPYIDADLYREQFPTELYRQHYGLPSMGLNP